MTLSIFIVIGLIALIYLISLTVQQVPRYENFVEHQKNMLCSFLENQRIQYHIKDCVMALSTGHGSNQRSQIWTSGSQINEKMHYRIGGQGITIMTYLVLMLSDRQILNIDSPIHQYLPRVPNSHTITLRHLCQMTAGLPDYISDPGFIQAFADNPFKIYTNQELLNLVYQLTPLYPAGTNWNFGHMTNTLIIGNIIEMATKKSYGEIVKQYFIDPLKLKNTQYVVNQNIQPPVLHSFTDERLKPYQYEDSTYWHPSWGAYATGLNSTPADMLIIARTLGTGAFLKPESFKQLVAPTTVGLANNQANKYYAMGLGVGGFGLDSLKTQKYPYSVLWSNASFGGYTGVYAYVPSHDLVVHIQTNTSNQLVPEATATKILENLFAQFPIQTIINNIA